MQRILVVLCILFCMAVVVHDLKQPPNMEQLLFEAVIRDKGHKEVKKLIKNGAPVNAQDGMGMTPLHWAVYKGTSDTVNVLLDAGANVKLRDKDGHDPLFFAQHKERANVVALLEAAAQK